MSYGKLITRFMTGGHDIFITCPAKSMHREGSRCMLFVGQVMKISYPPVVQRVITTHFKYYSVVYSISDWLSVCSSVCSFSAVFSSICNRVSLTAVFPFCNGATS